jgi:Tol biopolymer transport system component
MSSIKIGIALAAAVFCGMATLARGGESSVLIVFSSDRSGPWRLWTVAPDGSNLKQFSEAQRDEQDVDPVFSSDGRTILFTSTRGGTTGLWTMSVGGSSYKRICDGDQGEWSPDAKRIVFRRDEALYIRELATERETRISPADWPHPSGPAWSPDGKQIAFACRWDSGNAIFVVAAGGGEPKKLYDKKGACEPHWSPDGKRLVYETETNLAAINPDGTKNRPLTWFGGVQRYGRYSPDGKSIVFCQGVSERGPWELYRIPASGGQPAKITEGGSDMNPDWK